MSAPFSTIRQWYGMVYLIIQDCAYTADPPIDLGWTE